MSFSRNGYGVPNLSRSVSLVGNNDTGSTILKATVTKIDASDLGLVDPSIESDVFSCVGVTKNDILDGESGEVVSSGVISDISGVFGFGSTLYLSSTGGLTETKPTIGVDGFVAGDYVVMVGVVVVNSDNPLQKDLLVNLQIIGQL